MVPQSFFYTTKYTIQKNTWRKTLYLYIAYNYTEIELKWFHFAGKPTFPISTSLWPRNRGTLCILESTNLNSCDLHPAMMISLNLVVWGGLAQQITPTASLKFFYHHLLTIRHQLVGTDLSQEELHGNGNRILPSGLWSQVGLGSPWGLDHPIQQKHPESTWISLEHDPGYKHVALNMFSALLDICYGELANVVWFLLLF